MGVLDDAIREHLELKRRHGASEAELAKAEAEALGPARRDPTPDPYAEPGTAEAGFVHGEMYDPGSPPSSYASEPPSPTGPFDHEEPAPPAGLYDHVEPEVSGGTHSEPSAPAPYEPSGAAPSGPPAPDPHVHEEPPFEAEPEPAHGYDGFDTEDPHAPPEPALPGAGAQSLPPAEQPPRQHDFDAEEPAAAALHAEPENDFPEPSPEPRAGDPYVGDSPAVPAEREEPATEIWPGESSAAEAAPGPPGPAPLDEPGVPAPPEPTAANGPPAQLEGAGLEPPGPVSLPEQSAAADRPRAADVGARDVAGPEPPAPDAFAPDAPAEGAPLEPSSPEPATEAAAAEEPAAQADALEPTEPGLSEDEREYRAAAADPPTEHYTAPDIARYEQEQGYVDDEPRGGGRIRRWLSRRSRR